MKKRFFALLTLLAVTFSVFGFSSGVLALDHQYTNTLYRGGSSQYFEKDMKEGVGAWAAKISYAVVPGLPVGIFGNNYIVTRMRVPTGSVPNGYEASSTITFNCNTYQKTMYQDYYYDLGYGGVGEFYNMFASMKSNSTSTRGTFTIQFSA